MFNIGGGELLVIMLIALIVLGPSRLPDAARQIGKTMGDLRRLSSGFQNEMRSALDTVDDPTRVSARRNVLAKDSPEPANGATDAGNTASPVAGAIAAVSGQAPAPVRSTPRKAPLKAAATKKAPVVRKAGSAKNGTPVKKPSAQTTTTKKTAAKKTAARKAAPGVSKAVPRRTTT